MLERPDYQELLMPGTSVRSHRLGHPGWCHLRFNAAHCISGSVSSWYQLVQCPRSTAGALYEPMAPAHPVPGDSGDCLVFPRLWSEKWATPQASIFNSQSARIYLSDSFHQEVWAHSSAMDCRLPEHSVLMFDNSPSTDVSHSGNSDPRTWS